MAGGVNNLPRGQGHGEWRGAWSDGAAEWQAVSAAHRRQLDVRFDPDGEFWMSLDDYVRYLQTTSGVATTTGRHLGLVCCERLSLIHI